MKKRLLLILMIITLTCTCVLSSCAKKGDTDDAAVNVKDELSDNEQTESDDKTESKPADKEEAAPSDKQETGTTDKEDKKPSDKEETAPEQEKEEDSVGDGECKHAFGEWQVERKVTCIWEGKSFRTCSKCGKKEEKTVPKSDDHTEVVMPAVEPTCAVEGKTEGKQCSYCYTVTVPQKSVPKKEHNFKNGYSCVCGDFIESAKFVVMSQNVRYGNDGENKNVSDRAPRFKQLVELYKADLIGTQETTPTWNKFYEENLKDYGMIGCSRDGENAKTGEWGTILYRRDRFEVMDSDTFWLSDTPEKVSRVSGSKCNRICTWALLKDKNTDKIFVFANTHLDHGTDEVREDQIEILFKELSDLMSKYPIILTGDFNATPSSAVYATATKTLKDSRTEATENRSVVNHTYDGYGTSSGKIIDYCFYNDKASATWYKVANDQFGGYVSDHYGVVTEFGIK